MDKNKFKNVPCESSFDALNEEQKDFIINFVRENFIPTQTINKRHSGYGLKQKFSRLHFYVTEEQFGEAMHRAGFKVQTSLPRQFFNISQKSPYFQL